MTAFGVAEFAAGLLLAFLTLRDVVDTAVVPGRTGGALKILRRIVRFSLPLWRRGRTPAQGISTAFAPSALVKAFVLWMAFLTLGFGLMVHALAFSFEPALPSFPQALFVAGSGLVTVGLSETDAMGWARWVVMASGFCGFAVVTLSVTYLLQVQEALAGRDTAVLKLMTSAGKPPSGLGLLERYADLGCVDDLGDLMREARTWCAQTAQSHASHPSLIYFRSAGTACGWPAALGAMLDLSLIVERLIDRPDWRGQAVLLRDEGRAMIERVMDIVDLDHPPVAAGEEEVEALLRRLGAAGYPLRPDADPEAFRIERGPHVRCLRRLGDHLGSMASPLVPDQTR